MIASLYGRRRRGAPDDRSLGCVLRPSGLATVRGVREAPGPTHTRARGTKNEPTSGPTPRSTIDPFHPARVRLRPVGNSYPGLRLLRRRALRIGRDERLAFLDDVRSEFRGVPGADVLRRVDR